MRTSARRLRLVIPTLTFAAGLALSVAVYATSRAEARAQLHLRLERRMRDFGEALGSTARAPGDSLRLLRAMLLLRPTVEEAELRSLASAVRAESPGLRAVGWAPRTAGAGGDRYPIAIIEPAAPNGSVLGFDIAADPARHPALARALATGAPVATAPLALRPSGRGFVVLLSVREQGGMLVAPVDTDELIAFALRRSGELGVELALTDVTPGEPERRIDSSASADAPAELSLLLPDIAGRRWRADAWVKPEHGMRVLGAPEAILALGVLLSLAISALATVLQGRGARVRALVERRARELAASEAARCESEARFRAFMSHMPMAAWLKDTEGRLLWANPAFARAAKRAPADCIGKTDLELFGPEVAEQLRHGDQRTLAADTPELSEESFPVEGGASHWMLSRFPFADPSGRRYLASTSIDITGRKRVEAELEAERANLAARVAERTAELSRANAELARAGRMKDEFLANMSHELRTPLHSILGLAEALGDSVYGPLGDRQRSSLRIIEESGRHLLELINDILSLSKIEAGAMRLELRADSVERVVRAAVKLVQEPAHRKQLTVEMSTDAAISMLVAD